MNGGLSNPSLIGNDPLAVAVALAERLATTARQRDREGGTAKAERAMIRESGLLKLSVPADWGGWGAPWPTVFRVVRALATADASLAQVYGFQHVLLATCRLFGTPEQARRLLGETATNNWFWGNALNPLDRRLALITTPAGKVLRGDKSYSTGSLDSDMLIVSALEEGTGKLIVAALPTTRPGITLHDDWDNMGQRQTDSGSSHFADVELRDDEILASPGPLGSVFAGLRPLISQLTFTNVFLGIAEGALAEAKAYVRTRTRPWAGSGIDDNARDPYVLERFGNMYAHTLAARAVAENAAEDFERAFGRGDDLTTDERGLLAVNVAAAKTLATRAVLDITSQIFETMGASATAGRWGFDRFWRNARTLTLHDRLDYKVRDLGHWFLNDECPAPSFYS